MSSPSTDSNLSTPSEDFEEFPTPSELQDAWPIHTLAMAEQLFSDQYGRLSAPSQEWTPSSAVRDYTISEPHIHRGDDSETMYSHNHQVSSFNLPLIYDSTLTTPVSLHPESPNPHGKTLNDAQWSRNEHPQLQYPLRSNDSIYINTNSMSMKSKNDSITISSSDPDNLLTISPYIFDSPSTPCPPTPYWGSFGVSAPSTTSAATSASTPSNANPTVNAAPPGGSNQAPILIAPSPNRRPRQHIPDESLIQNPSQQGLQIQMSAQVQQPHIQPPPVGIKRECPSPTSRPKRRRRSAPPTEQQKPLSRDDLSEEDKILLHLRDIKEEEKWDWKELTERFNRETGGKHNLAALQMRHTRLVERMRVWTDVEVHAFQFVSIPSHNCTIVLFKISLRIHISIPLAFFHYVLHPIRATNLNEQIRALNRAKVQYDNQRWKIIAESMLDYGCETKWSPHACQLKWQELHPSEGAFEEYGTGSWNDNNTTASTPQRQNSGISFSREDGEGDDGGGNTNVIIDQTSQVSMRQRTGSKGSSRGSRSAYEQRQDWTVRPQ